MNKTSVKHNLDELNYQAIMTLESNGNKNPTQDEIDLMIASLINQPKVTQGA